MVISDNEWDQRILCTDGNCIGTIGADGRCRLCGLPYDGEMPLPAVNADKEQEGDEQFPDHQPAADDVAARLGDDAATELPGSEDDEDWEDRTLCVDESCIGVVGPDGRCKECGKPFNG
jgi:hypothetical protein